MAGGVGSRLYPLSTPERPKQFLDLLGCGKTLIQLTYERFLAVDPDARFWVVTSERYADFVREQLPAVPEEQILLEPEARNTAPCIAYACRKISAKYPDANIINTPADAYVPDVRAFAATMQKALKFTGAGNGIVCVGIRPTDPNTGYGYIKSSDGGKDASKDAGKDASKGAGKDAAGGSAIVKVESFKEKPDLATAKRYLAEGGYAWNAGIFVWSSHTIESELRTHAPQICEVMDIIAPSFYTPEEQSSLKAHFPECEKISIDYAVMEKSDNIYTISADWAWSDLGSFEAIEKVRLDSKAG